MFLQSTALGVQIHVYARNSAAGRLESLSLPTWAGVPQQHLVLLLSPPPSLSLCIPWVNYRYQCEGLAVQGRWRIKQKTSHGLEVLVVFGRSGQLWIGVRASSIGHLLACNFRGSRQREHTLKHSHRRRRSVHDATCVFPRLPA